MKVGRLLPDHPAGGAGAVVLVLTALIAGGCSGAAPPTASPLSAAPSAAPKASNAASRSTAPAPSPASAAPKPAPPSEPASAAGGAVKIAFAQPAAAFAPLWLAQDRGLFKKYGLETEVLRVAPPADVQAVIGGDIQIAVGGTAAISAMANGANLTFIAVTVPVYLQSLFGQPSIQKVSDLAGKSVAVTTKGGPSDFALRTLLAREGVDASKLNFVYLRDDSTILAALQSGQVQGAIITSPNTLRARQAGLRQLEDLIPLKLHTVTQGSFVRKDWAQQHPDVIGNYLKAYLEGIKEDKTNPDGAKTTISKWTKIEDQALLDESYKTTINGLAAYPLAHDEDIQNVIDLSIEAIVKSHKPSDFYANSYLLKLEAFVKGLWPNGIPSA